MGELPGLEDRETVLEHVNECLGCQVAQAGKPWRHWSAIVTWLVGSAVLNALALAKKQLGSLNRLSRVVRLGVYVAATPEFTEHGGR